MLISDKSQIQTELFGSITFRLNGEHVTDFRTRKAEAMMIYLVCNSGNHEREFLANLLWGELPQERAMANVRLTLNNLRNIFGEVFEANRQIVGIRPETSYWLDVEHLDNLSIDLGDDIDHLQAVLQLYKGNFLQGFHLKDALEFGEWQSIQRERWHQKAILGIHKLINLYMYQGQYTVAIDWCNRLLQLDLLDETAHQKLMLLLARSGNRIAALKQYEICKKYLWDGLAIEVSFETETLYRKLRQLGNQRNHNLPTGFLEKSVGRDSEFFQIKKYLAHPNNRLISLIGMGGIGKTHLALRVGWFVIEDRYGPFLDGVYFVSLNSESYDNHDTVTTTNLVDAIVSALSLLLLPTRPAQDQVLDYLTDRELLLIIDNGEYLYSEAFQYLLDILRFAPNIQILIASRHTFNSPKETIIRLEGLTYPKILNHRLQDKQSRILTKQINELLGYDAVQLFIEVAHRSNQHFSIDKLNAVERSALIAISQLIEGMPLAIELVASWLHIFSLEQIEVKLRKSIDLLRLTTPNDIKHHSIRAVFEQSWSLLSDSEKIGLESLSIFAGDFDLKAAITIIEINPEVISQLVNKSLVENFTRKGKKRFRLHSLLRQYAYEKLGEKKNRIEANLSHYYGNLLTQLEPQLASSNSPKVLEQIKHEIPNIRLGWQYTVANIHTNLSILYVPSLYNFYANIGWWNEGKHIFETAIAKINTLGKLAPSSPLWLLLAQLLPRLAQFYYVLDDLEQADYLLKESQKVAHFVEEPHELMLTYKKIGELHRRQGSNQQAIEALKFSLDIVRELEMPSSEAHALMSLSQVYREIGNYEEALNLITQSLHIYQELQYQWGTMHALRLLGTLTYKVGKYDPHLLDESLKIAQLIQDALGEALALNGQGEIALAEGEYQSAEALFNKALEIFESIEGKRGQTITLINLATLSQTTNNYEKYKIYIHRILKYLEQVKDIRLSLEFINLIIYSLIQIKDYKSAFELYSVAINHVATPYETQQKLKKIINNIDYPNGEKQKIRSKTNLNFDLIIEVIKLAMKIM